MTNLAARFNFSRRSAEQTPAGMPPPNGSRRLGVRSEVNKPRTREISAPIAAPISSTMDIENVAFSPRYCTTQPQHCGATDRSGVDFDIAYFYGDAAQPTVHGSNASSPRASLKVGSHSIYHDKQILVPLLAAQLQDSIRRRAEGFEMQESDPTSTAPFQQKLISLQDAMARDDIRRRDEGFESVSGGRLPLVPQPHLAPPTASVPCRLTQQTPSPVSENSFQLCPDPPTTPSVYSSESWAESFRVISAARSLSAVSSADLGFYWCQKPEVSRIGSPRALSSTPVGDIRSVHSQALSG